MIYVGALMGNCNPSLYHKEFPANFAQGVVDPIVTPGHPQWGALVEIDRIVEDTARSVLVEEA
jgi:hypothetical protein